MIANHLMEIYEHFQNEYPREGCGVIAVKRGKTAFIPCNNLADSNEDFILDSKQFFDISRTADIIAIIHDHITVSEEPSTHDMKASDALGIPYIIFKFPSMEFYTYNPKGVPNKPLIGREYEFGISDCFEAVKDYYKDKLDIDIGNRDAFEQGWWRRGLDYFTTEYIRDRGFYPVDIKDLKPGDLLVFRISSTIPNHCGVYIGDNLFYHHAIHRLSCREPLNGVWLEGLEKAYRYEDRRITTR